MVFDDFIDVWHPTEDDDRQSVTTRRDKRGWLIVDKPNHSDTVRIINENECPEQGKIVIKVIETNVSMEDEIVLTGDVRFSKTYTKARYIDRPNNNGAERRLELQKEGDITGSKNSLAKNRC